MLIDGSELDKLVRIERKTAGTGFGRAGKEAWELVDEVWAQVRDTLPSRSERTDDGLPMAIGQARVRMYHRDDVTADMRIVHGTRIMEIVGGPATIGDREGLEMVVQNYSTAGGTK